MNIDEIKSVKYVRYRYLLRRKVPVLQSPSHRARGGSVPLGFLTGVHHRRRHVSLFNVRLESINHSLAICVIAARDRLVRVALLINQK